MPAMQNHCGRPFGRITLSEPVLGKTGYWKGKCSCGNTVEKRIDNLRRPGDHSCGKCFVPTPISVNSLEERVRRLEQFIASFDLTFLPGPTLARDKPLNSSVVSEVREPGRALLPSESSDVSELLPKPLASRFSRVFYDAEGELWEARTLTGRPFFWGVSEEEAAFAARLYLELTHSTFNNRIITDSELTLSGERREEIRFEISDGL